MNYNFTQVWLCEKIVRVIVVTSDQGRCSINNK